MAEFIYKAKKGLEDTIEGTITAASRDDAVNRLLKEGLFPVSVELSVSAAVVPKAELRSKAPGIFSAIGFKKKITSREVLIFTQKLTTLIRAKVELLASLKILYEQTESARFKEIILELYNSTKKGATFSTSLKCFSNIFSPLYVNIVRSGEASGRMDSALEQIGEFLDREESMRAKILVAMAYPALLLSVGLVSIFVLINFVIPKLKPIFAGLGDKLPLITRVILNISAISHKSWLWIFGIAVIVLALLYRQKGAPFFSRMGRRLKANLPVIKRLSKNQELTHFAKSLALLLNGGVSALTALEIATLTVENPKFRGELNMVYKEVSQGKRLSKSMQDFTSFPAFFIKMIAVGEESGRLGEVLEEISHSYTEQLESDIMLINSLIEPVLILGLGVILGTIVLAILLPTFQVTQMVR